MKEKFKELTNKYPSLSSAIVFSKLIRDRKMGRVQINKWFRTLVDKSDYEKEDKKQLTTFYWKLSNGLE